MVKLEIDLEAIKVVVIVVVVFVLLLLLLLRVLYSYYYSKGMVEYVVLDRVDDDDRKKNDDDDGAAANLFFGLVRRSVKGGLKVCSFLGFLKFVWNVVSFLFLFATFRVFCVWTKTLLSSMEYL